MTPRQPQVAIGAVVIHEGKILLVKRKNPPGKNFWALPGGSVRWGETLQEATIREIKEETGLLIKPQEIVETLEVIEKDKAGQVIFHYLIVDFRAKFLGGSLEAGDDALAAGWFSPEDTRGLKLTSSTRRLLEKLDFL